MVQPSAVQVPPRDLRPRRRWYLVGLGVFLVCVVAGGVVAAVLVLAGAKQGGDLHRLSDGNRVTLTAGDDKYLYATGDEANRVGVPVCRTSGPSAPRLGMTRSSQTLTEDGVTWVAVARLHVPVAGTYTIDCPPDDSYAIGNSAFGVLGRVFGGIGAFFGLALVGLLAGGTIALVTFVRRSGDRRRRRVAVGQPQPWAR
ncbi:MAG: hypothetical protein J2P24_18150 [Streptosporangiales bacterium]|nr:hypothetical protein [Streptosporangiales bacterium]